MLLPFLFLISASFLLPGCCEVVPSFNKCAGFFFKKKFPNDALKPWNPARICQRHKNKYVFATMYDKTRRIPIYSAYIYNPKPGHRAENWMIEPQLANSRYGRNMADERLTTIPVAEIKASQATFNDYKAACYYVDKGHLNPVAHQPDQVSKATTFALQLANSRYGRNMADEQSTTIPVAEIKASQATFNDYKAACYYVDKGHLNPVAHQPDQVSKAATFTLTNIVPQFNRLNRKSWRDYETKTMARKNAEFKCTKIYVITGAVPGKTSTTKGRVNYPSHIWSAACCVIDAKRRKSWGAIADNSWKIPPNVIPPVTEHTLKKLEQVLQKLYKKRKVDLFGSSCY